jgi:hypothetical protein
LQVHVDLGIADHVWQKKAAAIAATVYALGDRFKPALRAVWLSNIRETFTDGAVEARPSVGEVTLVLLD